MKTKRGKSLIGILLILTGTISLLASACAPPADKAGDAAGPKPVTLDPRGQGPDVQRPGQDRALPRRRPGAVHPLGAQLPARHGDLLAAQRRLGRLHQALLCPGRDLQPDGLRRGRLGPPGQAGRHRVRLLHGQASRRLRHVRHGLQRLQDHQVALRQGHRRRRGRGLPQGGHPARVLLLARRLPLPVRDGQALRPSLRAGLHGRRAPFGPHEKDVSRLRAGPGRGAADQVRRRLHDLVRRQVRAAQEALLAGQAGRLHRPRRDPDSGAGDPRPGRRPGLGELHDHELAMVLPAQRRRPHGGRGHPQPDPHPGPRRQHAAQHRPAARRHDRPGRRGAAARAGAVDEPLRRGRARRAALDHDQRGRTSG